MVEFYKTQFYKAEYIQQIIGRAQIHNKQKIIATHKC